MNVEAQLPPCTAPSPRCTLGVKPSVRTPSDITGFRSVLQFSRTRTKAEQTLPDGTKKVFQHLLKLWAPREWKRNREQVMGSFCRHSEKQQSSDNSAKLCRSSYSPSVLMVRNGRRSNIIWDTQWLSTELFKKKWNDSQGAFYITWNKTLTEFSYSHLTRADFNRFFYHNPSVMTMHCYYCKKSCLTFVLILICIVI